jgi:hypothetical protein
MDFTVFRSPCAALSSFAHDAFDQRSRGRYVRLVGQMAFEILTRQMTRDRWVRGKRLDQRAAAVARPTRRQLDDSMGFTASNVSGKRHRDGL